MYFKINMNVKQEFTIAWIIGRLFFSCLLFGVVTNRGDFNEIKTETVV